MVVVRQFMCLFVTHICRAEVIISWYMILQGAVIFSNNQNQNVKPFQEFDEYFQVKEAR